MVNKHKGSSFDSFLDEEGLLEDAEAVAIKRVIAYALQEEMKKKHMTKSDAAAKLHTSRASLERLLNPENTSITLRTLVRAAHMAGKKLNISLS